MQNLLKNRHDQFATNFDYLMLSVPNDSISLQSDVIQSMKKASEPQPLQVLEGIPEREMLKKKTVRLAMKTILNNLWV